MIFQFHIPAEFRSGSYWERALGVVVEGETKVIANFVPNGPIYPEPNGAAFLFLAIQRGDARIPLAQLYVTKKILHAFVPVGFVFLADDRSSLEPGDVLVLSKDNQKTKGMSMPDSLVQVNTWP